MSILGFKKKNTLALVAAAAILASGVGVYKSNAAGRVDLNADVTITAVVDSVNDTSEFAQKYVGDVEIELYKIADLDAAGNPIISDEFKASDIDLSVIDSDTTVEETKTKIVEPADKFVAENRAKLTKVVIDGNKTADGMTASKTIKNGAGLYLYRVSNTVQDAENTYIFTPAVFFAPTSERIVSGQGADTWNYNVTIAPKAKAERRYGDLEINKTLKTFNKSLGTASCVFEVEGIDSSNKTVFSNVYTMNFDSADTQTIKIEHIPSNIICKVTEVYSGASYSEVAVPVENSSENGVRIIADEVVDVNFANDYDDRLNVGGLGVENHFEQNKTEADGTTGFSYDWKGSNLPSSTEDN